MRVAGRLATALGLRLVLVHVERDGAEIGVGEIAFESVLDAGTRARLRIVQRAAKEVPDAEVNACLASGSPIRALEEVAARESAEIIAVGNRGQSAFKALALGSVSRVLAASGHRPVLVVNERPSRSAGDADG